MITYVVVAFMSCVSFLMGYCIGLFAVRGSHICPNRILKQSRERAAWSRKELIHMATCVRCEMAVDNMERAVAEQLSWSVCVDDFGAPVVRITSFKIPPGDTRIYNVFGQPFDGLYSDEDYRASLRSQG